MTRYYLRPGLIPEIFLLIILFSVNETNLKFLLFLHDLNELLSHSTHAACNR